MSENSAETPTDAPKGDEGAETTFTQADVDKLVGKARTEERRKASERFADYDDLKAKAEGAKTAEQRIGSLEQEISATKHEALRRRVQAAHSISDDDADLFLTGADEEALTSQAKRLAERDSDRKKDGNRVPGEGRTPSDTPKRSSWSGTLAALDEQRT